MFSSIVVLEKKVRDVQKECPGGVRRRKERGGGWERERFYSFASVNRTLLGIIHRGFTIKATARVLLSKGDNKVLAVLSRETHRRNFITGTVCTGGTGLSSLTCSTIEYNQCMSSHKYRYSFNSCQKFFLLKCQIFQGVEISQYFCQILQQY